MILSGRRGAAPYKLKPKHNQQTKQEIKSFIRFFFCIYRRKRKSYQKENADGEISRFAKRDHRCRWTTPPFKKKAGENFKITT